MGTIDIQSLKDRARQEYEAEAAEAKRKYEARLKAIEWIALQQHPVATKKPRDTATELSDLASKMVPLLPEEGTFTGPDIEKLVKASHPGLSSGLSRVRTRRAMNELAENGNIEVFLAGKGGRATTYRLRHGGDE